MKEKHEKKTALVGFSANTEILTSYDGISTLEKAPLHSMSARIGGTSANVALAINAFGGNSKLLALTGEGSDLSTHMLEYVLQKCTIDHRKFPILDTSHIALIPDDGIQTKKVFGLKGTIRTDRLPETFAEIEKEEGLWRIATGVRLEEVELVKCLFNKHFGFRSLNPRMELIANTKLFHEVLSSTDLLIMNASEYQTCKVTSPDKLHEYGPSLIIVTDGENGGMFSRKETGAEIFNACTDYIHKGTKVYTTGAGDWFHGSFMSRCLSLGEKVPDITREQTIDFLKFATRVSGKKVTMEGASNGPTEKDL